MRFLQAAQTGLYMAPIEAIDRHFVPYRDEDLKEQKRPPMTPSDPPSDLVTLVQTMVAESGDPAGFDAAAWLANWMQRPVPALGNRTPLSFMGTEEGRDLVKQILLRMQSGAYS
nr:MbcA/ParS/Xre antitoxin family protein [Roseococcus sp. MDT2-1-1]